MKIILTNDDGIEAPGLEALRRVSGRWGEVFVVAPGECHSMMGHRVTTDGAIQVDRLSEHRYRVHGTPADCVRIAVMHLVPGADWVFSGINRGGNLGADIYISGTVAAAREAALLGYPALAISHYVGKRRDVNWGVAESRAAQGIEHALLNPPQAGRFWNINLPHPADDAAECSLALCPLDTGPLGVLYRRDGEEFHYCGDYHQRPRVPGHDVDECFSGKIAATLL